MTVNTTGLWISGIILTQIHAIETVEMIGVGDSQMSKCIRIMWGT